MYLRIRLQKKEGKITIMSETKGELTKVQQFQTNEIIRIEKTLKNSGLDLTPYQKKCGINAIAGIISFLKEQGKSFDDIDMNLLRLSIQNVALTELNYAAIPAEIYFDLRGSVLTVKPQGAGNEKLTRTYGVDVSSISMPWLIREGDDFTLPGYDGETCVPPKWTMKSLDKKVIAVCYMVKKTDGSTEWLISGREEVAGNLIAQIRQNALYKFNKKDKDGKLIFNKYGKPIVDTEARDKFYDSLNDRKLDDLLGDPNLKEFINPTYTSGGSKEAMIIRKMKNNALKLYPKEYDNSLQKEAVENMFEEDDKSIKVNTNPDDVIDATTPVAEAPKDFTVDDDGVVTKPVAQEPEKEDNDIEEDAEESTTEPVEEPKPTQAEKKETKPLVDTDYGI